MCDEFPSAAWPGRLAQATKAKVPVEQLQRCHQRLRQYQQQGTAIIWLMATRHSYHLLTEPARTGKPSLGRPRGGPRSARWPAGHITMGNHRGGALGMEAYLLF